MRTVLWMNVVLMIVIVSGIGLASAEESAPAATSAPATSSDAPAPSAPPAASSAPAAPAAESAATPLVPTLRPIVIKFSGEVVQLNKQSAGQPILTVRDRYGVTKEMVADPSAAKIQRGTAPATLEELKQGDQVSVEYTYDVASGKRHIQTVTIAEATPAPATTPSGN